MSTCCKQPLFQASSWQRGGRWRETPELKPRPLTSCGWFPHTRWGREGGEGWGCGGGYPRRRWGRDEASKKPLKPLLVSYLLLAECSQSPRAHSLNGAAINGPILCSYTGERCYPSLPLHGWTASGSHILKHHYHSGGGGTLWVNQWVISASSPQQQRIQRHRLGEVQEYSSWNLENIYGAEI